MPGRVEEVSGADLSRLLHHEVVAPALHASWPGLGYAAGRLGSGSDVLGYDDEVSRDHDWGPRLNLLVPADLAADVDAHLDACLPERFRGHPVRFATSWDASVRHRVQVEDVATFVTSRTGLAGAVPGSVADWLSLTGQAVLEVTAGPVFVDSSGELTAVRDRLEWYPDDLWAHLVATDWARLAQELPFVGRTAERDDDLGSMVVAARLVEVAMHLAHLLARRWPPYAKWLGTSLQRLPGGAEVGDALGRTLAADDWQARETGLVDALRVLTRRQRDAGLPTVADPVEPFFGRRYRGVRDEVVSLLEAAVRDPVVRALPRGVGSVQQWSHNVDVLVHPARRRAVASC